MLRAVKRGIRRLLGAGGYAVLGTGQFSQMVDELAQLRRAADASLLAITAAATELAETKGGVSATQQQVGEIWSHIIAARQESVAVAKEIAEIKGGVSASQGQIGEIWSHLIAARQEAAAVASEIAEIKGRGSAGRGQVGEIWSHVIAARQEAAAAAKEIAEIKDRVSTSQRQVGEIWSHMVALRQDFLKPATGGNAIPGNERLRPPAEEASTSEQLSGWTDRYEHIRDVPRYLDLAATRCRAENSDGETAENLALANHYARWATLVSQYWLGGGELPKDPYPDDDMTLDYAKGIGAYRPGEDVDEVFHHQELLPWRPLWSDADCGIFLVLGQSNAANHGDTRYTPRRDVCSLDFLRMSCYRAADPLPGASGSGGSIWSRLGERLIDEGIFRRVLFVPMAFAGTYISDWVPGGGMHQRTSVALSRLRKQLNTSFLPFSAVLWQQGEAEANNTQMSVRTYRTHFYDIVAHLRANGVFAPIFVSRASLCEAAPNPFDNRAAIREAQFGLADPSSGILLGPDIDTVGRADRFDGCHFAESGLQLASDLWLSALSTRQNLLRKPLSNTPSNGT